MPAAGPGSARTAGGRWEDIKDAQTQTAAIGRAVSPRAGGGGPASAAAPGGGPVRIYHYRVRDGVPVVWLEDGPRLTLLAPHGRPLSAGGGSRRRSWRTPIGRRQAWPLVRRFAKWLRAKGRRWDLSEHDIRSWAANQP